MNQPQRLLFVFGLRGTLVERLGASDIPAGIRPADHIMGRYSIWLRPKATEALTALSEFADLAIWSATPHRNTVPLAQMAFPTIPFQFMWHRDHTVPDRLRRRIGGLSDRVDAFSVMKDLSKIYAERPTHASPQRTIAVDDTPYKVRNHAGNILLVPTFDVESLRRESVAGKADDALMRVVEYARTLHNLEDVRVVLPKRIQVEASA